MHQLCYQDWIVNSLIYELINYFNFYLPLLNPFQIYFLINSCSRCYYYYCCWQVITFQVKSSTSVFIYQSKNLQLKLLVEPVMLVETKLTSYLAIFTQILTLYQLQIIKLHWVYLFSLFFHQFFCFSYHLIEFAMKFYSLELIQHRDLYEIHHHLHLLRIFLNSHSFLC